jgi:hypothetical protein
LSTAVNSSGLSGGASACRAWACAAAELLRPRKLKIVREIEKSRKCFGGNGLGIPACAGVAARKSAPRGKLFGLLFYAN